MNLDKKQFEFIKKLSWKDVFNIWYDNEANEPHWKEYYKKEGFNSWYDWRKKYIDPIKNLNKEWKLIKVINPLKSILDFRGGPYKGWKDFYNNQNLPKFKNIKEHPRAKDYLKGLSKKTTIIAWNTEKGIVIIEGMHRCAGIAKAAKENKQINLDLYIAIANCFIKDIPDFRNESNK
ncbi:hypothetical protein KJ684_02165 [Patescibacteria group bacterium]|nr:hypothetical protein [Patescibacteria group bacterium]